jgi:hypothetical protein
MSGSNALNKLERPQDHEEEPRDDVDHGQERVLWEADIDVGFDCPGSRVYDGLRGVDEIQRSENHRGEPDVARTRTVLHSARPIQRDDVMRSPQK